MGAGKFQWCMIEHVGYHTNLYNCFIIKQSQKTYKWTDHGTQCGICLVELKM
ncbi:MAG: PCYCGC motif-containing (lipo)protein [Candidatus Pristimantibacillus sp.]